jgi:polysaccharide biosynthesis transport protein
MMSFAQQLGHLSAFQAFEAIRPARVLRRWLPAVILCAVLAGLSAGAVSKLLPPVWEGQSELVVKPAQPLSNPDPGAAQLTSDQVTLTYAALLVQPPQLEAVISDLHLRLTAVELQSKIRVTPTPNTTILEVAVRDTNRRLAVDIANRLVQDFVQRVTGIQQQQTEQDTARLRSQIQDLEGTIARDQVTIGTLQAAAAAGRLASDQQVALSAAEEELAAAQLHRADLVTSLAQIEAQSALAIDSVIVVSPATPPDQPVSPRLSVNVPLAAVLALLVALGVAFAVEHFDKSIRSAEELTDRTGLAVLGHIPMVRLTAVRQGEMVTRTGENSSAAEAYKALRTNLMFSTFTRQAATILITSPMPDEGKSHVAANLAAVMAEAGHRTLIVDADFRRPRLHRIYGRVRNLGLSNLVVDDAQGDDLVKPVSGVSNLWLVSSGPTPPNPSELLGSPQMKELLVKFREQFAYVLVDSPPVNVVTDPSVLTADADATVLVIEQGRTTYTAVLRAKQTLTQVGGNVIGVVFNKCQRGGDSYYYEHEYYTASSDGDGSDNGAHSPRETTRVF